MGMGLILAGLGKGISDAGTTYGSLMFKAAESELADQRALQKADALERMKEEREEAKLQRDADIYTKAQANAQQVGSARQAAVLEKDASSLSENAQTIAGESPAATPEEMKRHLERLTPAERKAIEGTGLISGEMSKTRQEMQGYEDVVNEARKLGGSATLMKSLQEAKKERLSEIKAELSERKEDRRYEMDQAREERRAGEFQAMLGVRQQQADAATTRAGASVTSANASATRAARPPSSSGGGRSGSTDKPATTADLQRQINATKDDIALELGVPKNEVNQTVAQLRKRADRGDKAAQQTLDRVQPFFNELQSANDRMRQFKRTDEPKPSSDNQRAVVDALPKGAVQVGTSGGRPVYQTPDGRKFIAK